MAWGFVVFGIFVSELLLGKEVVCLLYGMRVEGGKAFK